MDLPGVLEVFTTEASALGRAVAGFADGQWDRRTRCAPWSVRELLGHVCVGLGWVPGMIAQAAPERAEVSAAGYYRPDHRFDTSANAVRIALGRERLAGLEPGALPAAFASVWQEVASRCSREPDDRVVRTRHGDAMLLADFLRTRVVELALHGLDLADAAECEPWLTAPATDVVLGLLFGDEMDRVDEAGLTKESMLRAATGRAKPGVAEADRLENLGIRRLALG
jgi:uncharacterized protein (TIGR03083 family)